MFSCYSAINLPVEFCVAFSGGTGNNKEQTLQSTEEDYFPSFLLLIGMSLEGQCCLKDFAVIIITPLCVSVSNTASSGARGESASVRTYSC